MELLNFFDEALQLGREDGSVVLEHGDCVIMDNCGFHHARFVEPVLRGMLGDCGVGLLYQPLYSPDFNTCEMCFHQVKGFLQRHQLLAEHETKIAIADVILVILGTPCRHVILPLNNLLELECCTVIAQFFSVSYIQPLFPHAKQTRGMEIQQSNLQLICIELA